MNCQLCKSKAVRRLRVVEKVQIYRCKACTVAFIDPKSPRKKTAHIYSFADYQAREDQFLKRYHGAEKLIKKYSHGKRVLEVGAGFGLLSSILFQQGFTVDVLEPDVTPRYLLGLAVKVHKQSLKSFARRNPKKKFDIVILYDVIEHVDDPHETVALLKSLLTSHGILVIQTPNYVSLMAKIVKHWSWWMVEDHRFLFSHTSLFSLFDTKEWKRVFYKTYEEWPDFKKNLDGNFTNKIQKALYLGFFIPFYFIFRTYLWKMGWGGLHLGIWEIKKG